jgi:hypothetical protein
MATDRQKVCKCGANVAEFLSDIRILEMNLKIAKVENSEIYIPAFKSSINSIYSNINKIEDDCAIDARDKKWSHSDIFNKIEKFEAIKDPKKFNENRADIIQDLDRITYGVVQKVKDCSK